jgi:hypothetical protein
MARPSKPKDQRAALVVGVRLTPAEKALVDQLTAPGPDGAPPCWTNASGLLRGLLHREAQRRGLEPPDSSDVDGNPGGGLDEPGPPGRPATVADSVTNPPGGGSGSSGGLPPAGPPYPALGGLPSALGGGVLPAGTLLLVWPPGWPLPMAPGGTFPVVAPPPPSPPAPGAHEFIPQGGPATPGAVSPNVPTHQLRETGAADVLPGSHPGAPALAGEASSMPAPGETPAGPVGGTFPSPGAVPVEAPRGVVPVPNLTAPGVSPPSMTPAPVETPPAGRDTPLPARPLPPMPEPSKMLARFERQLERSPGRMAKDVAAAAGLKPQDISTFRQGRRITEEKRAMLWTWMHRPDGAE